MRDTSVIGDATTAVILAALVKAGKVVLLPFGDRHRYDLGVEEQGIFLRIQCKTGRIRKNGVVFFRAHSITGMVRRGYQGDADLFGVYCPDNDKVYLVPVDEVPASGVSLRLVATKSGRNKGVRYADDYELRAA
jgi:hypothetical protein